MRNIFIIIFAIFILLLTSFIFIDYDLSYKNDKQRESIDRKEEKNLICNHGETVFCSTLPVIIIETSEKKNIDKEAVWSRLKVIDNKNKNNHLDDEARYDVRTSIKLRGQSSLLFDKKQYRIEIFEDTKDKEKKIPLLGMAKESDWILNGPYLDRTLIRNYLMYGISRKILDWAPNSKFCEVFLNNEYIGVYLLTETIKVSESRLNLKKYSLISGETAYLLKREIKGTEENPIKTYGTDHLKTSHELSISYPTSKNLNGYQKEWITNDISRFEKVLYSDYFDDENYGYMAYIDINSFVDYFIINEFAINLDASYLSTYIYKDLGGKLKLTVWDFNNSFDNYVTKTDVRSFNNYKYSWYGRLLQDKKFVERIVKRYFELRKSYLSNEYVFNQIDNTVLFLGDATKRNNERWWNTFNQVMLEPNVDGTIRDPRNYSEAILQLKDTIAKRTKFLDENIETLYQYKAE